MTRRKKYKQQDTHTHTAGANVKKCEIVRHICFYLLFLSLRYFREPGTDSLISHMLVLSLQEQVWLFPDESVSSECVGWEWLWETQCSLFWWTWWCFSDLYPPSRQSQLQLSSWRTWTRYWLNILCDLMYSHNAYSTENVCPQAQFASDLFLMGLYSQLGMNVTEHEAEITCFSQHIYRANFIDPASWERSLIYWRWDVAPSWNHNS